MTAQWTGTSPADPFGRLHPGLAADETASLDPEARRRVRWVLIGTGILAVLGGIAAIVVPIVASVTMTLFAGWMLMFYGVVALVHALRAHVRRSTKAWRALNAVLAFLVGFYLVVLPLSGTITLTFLLAVWFFGTGVVSLAAAWQFRGMPGAGWTAFDGTLSIVLGILIAASLPSSAEWAIGLLVGLYLIWWGTGALVAAWALGRRPSAG